MTTTLSPPAFAAIVAGLFAMTFVGALIALWWGRRGVYAELAELRQHLETAFYSSQDPKAAQELATQARNTQAALDRLTARWEADDAERRATEQRIDRAEEALDDLVERADVIQAALEGHDRRAHELERLTAERANAAARADAMASIVLRCLVDVLHSADMLSALEREELVETLDG